jgi:transposase
MAYIQAAHAQVQADPQGCVLLYQDELTYYRRPSLACAYAPSPSKSPAVPAGHTTNKVRRIAGSLDIHSGQFIALQRRHLDRAGLLLYYRQLEAAYPHAQRIFLVQDNWPVHFHPDILQALAASKIMLLRLPTYAPWTNPVEKVWRKLKQELLHLHVFEDNWLALQLAVQDWLDQFSSPSDILLRYVGLLPD